MNLVSARLLRENNRHLARFPGAELLLPLYAERDLSALSSDHVIVGVRPEDIHLVPTGGRSGDYGAIEALAVAVEPLGAETLLVMASGGDGEELVARLGRDVRITPGQTLKAHADLGQLHLFDPVTTKALPRSREAAASGQSASSVENA